MLNLEGRKKCLLDYLIIIFSVFMVFLIVWVGVSINNKVKEGRYIGQNIESKNTISVSGEAKIYAKPDLAITVISVKTEAKTVNEAMANNTKKMNIIIGFIKKIGVDAKDLKTVSFNIYPRYEWQKEMVCASSSCSSGRRILTGYEIDQSLEVKIRDLSKVGNVIEGATNAGANNVSGLRFIISEKDKLEKQARDEAIKKAKIRAKELASILGVKLVRINSFTENNASPIRYSYVPGITAEKAGAKTPQIESGENKIEANVTITYEIN